MVLEQFYRNFTAIYREPNFFLQLSFFLQIFLCFFFCSNENDFHGLAGN